MKVFKKLKCKIEVSSYESLKILTNKAKTYEFLEKNDLACPNWKCANSKLDLIKKINQMFDEKISEIIIKPASSRGSRDIFCISKKIIKEKDFYFPIIDYSQFKLKIDDIFKNQKTIIMEKYNSDIYDCDVHVVDGDLKNITLRKRFNKFLPNEGHRIVDHKVIKGLIERACKLLKLNSVHDFDLMIDNKNNFKIIEINPRISGSLCVSIKAGASYYKDMIYLSKNKNYKFKKAKVNSLIFPMKSLFSKSIS